MEWIALERALHQYLNVQNIDDKVHGSQFLGLYSGGVCARKCAKSLAAASTSRGPRRPNSVRVDANSPALSLARQRALESRAKSHQKSTVRRFLFVIGRMKSSRARRVVTNCVLRRAASPPDAKLILHRLKAVTIDRSTVSRSDIELIRTNAQIFHSKKRRFCKSPEELEDDLPRRPSDERARLFARRHEIIRHDRSHRHR